MSRWFSSCGPLHVFERCHKNAYLYFQSAAFGRCSYRAEALTVQNFKLCLKVDVIVTSIHCGFKPQFQKIKLIRKIRPGCRCWSSFLQSYGKDDCILDNSRVEGRVERRQLILWMYKGFSAVLQNLICHRPVSTLKDFIKSLYRRPRLMLWRGCDIRQNPVIYTG